MQIKVSELSKEYGGQPVLNDVSFTIFRDDKIGLVGYNGTGKSTLLKILAGEIRCEYGEVSGIEGVTIGYLPQDFSNLPNTTVRDYLAVSDEVYEYQMEKIMHGLNMKKIKLNDPVQELSSGQKCKVFLARILLQEPDLLLLDEPTNNLDMAALVWLEQFLKRTSSACVIVSHDRRFLDTVIGKIIEIDWQTRSVHVTTSRYSDYLDSKKLEYETQLATFMRQEKEAERLSKSIDRKQQSARAGSRYVGKDNDKYQRGHKRDRAARSGATAKAMERRRARVQTTAKPIEREALRAYLNPAAPKGAATIELGSVDIGYADAPIVRNVSFTIPYGSRVLVLGENGAGKSTLLKTLSGELQPLSGTVHMGRGVVLGNLTQEHHNLPLSEQFLYFFLDQTELNETDVYSIARKFGFSEHDVRKKIADFSPGGRARMSFALSAARSVNTLLLDEPTNHLDLEALIAMEDIVEKYTGTMILVSHDRFFMQSYNPSHVYLVEDGTLSSLASVEDYTNRYARIAELPF